MNNIKLFATDLDGTFLKDDRTISNKNMEALRLLGEKNIIRAVATGRNLRKVKEVLNEHVPFDYVVFSSGAGVFDWNLKKHIHSQNIEKESAQKLMQYFVEKKLSFHAFYPTPENHNHWYFRGKEYCEEFERYFSFNNAFASELNSRNLPATELCQFLIIIPEDGKKFDAMKSEIEAVCSEIRVVRTSSPITAGFIWIEIFHKTVSKGNGVNEICKLHEIDQKETVGIGNDYNDFDLLDFTGHSFITNNAPSEIKDMYESAPTNENDAFAFITQHLVK
ncbi:MAG: HAD family phosphatase [Bacteroidetes bacterium]|nr:HAD family phosphatase [Bacteroidota bacterium]